MCIFYPSNALYSRRTKAKKYKMQQEHSRKIKQKVFSQEAQSSIGKVSRQGAKEPDLLVNPGFSWGLGQITLGAFPKQIMVQISSKTASLECLSRPESSFKTLE